MQTEDYYTLSGTMTALRKKGYTEDFNLLENALECKAGGYTVSPDDFQIDDVFRFEGPSNPSDEAVLYAISVPRKNVKGLLVNGYGIYTDPVTNALLEKLVIKHK